LYIKAPQQYKIKVQTYDQTAGQALYLVDNHLNIVQQLQVGTEYTFDLTNDSLSQCE